MSRLHDQVDTLDAHATIATSTIQRFCAILAYTVDTHIHADPITSALELRNKVGSKIVTPAMERLDCTDLGIEEGVPFQVVSIRLDPMHTPGHTDGHFAYVFQDRIFT